MLIIVEGPDGAGKTSAVKSLASAYSDSLVYHFGAPVPGEDQFMRYAKPIIDFGSKLLLIYDRSWYSEFVYGPIMRNGSEISIDQCKILEQLVRINGGGHVLYLTSDIKTLWRRCTKRGETYIQSREVLEQVRDRYEAVMVDIASMVIFKVKT